MSFPAAVIPQSFQLYARALLSLKHVSPLWPVPHGELSARGAVLKTGHAGLHNIRLVRFIYRAIHCMSNASSYIGVTSNTCLI